MPKDLLQSSLRPILVNLAQTRSLTMPLLQGLARLLELLSNWFNVTLGAKLLDHLKKWLEPEKLAQSQKSWKAGDEPKIAAGDIFLSHINMFFHSFVSPNRILCVERTARQTSPHIYEPYLLHNNWV
jgi:hypothetical protein